MGHKPMDVAIFWDLASCPASGGKDLETSGFETVDRIRTLASQFGVIKAFKGYMSVANTDTQAYSSPWQPLKLRSQLQSSGVSVTDVPGRTDVAEKMAIVDMLAYAFDRSPNDTILVLITAEPSFSYTLSFLRLRKYRVVLIAPEIEETLTLLSQSPLSFNWTQGQASGPQSDARPKAPEASANSGSRESRRSSSTLPESNRPASGASDGTYAEKPSVVDKTPDVNLDDYLPQRQESIPIPEYEPIVPSHPRSDYEDPFDRNLGAFLPWSLPRGSMGLDQSQQEGHSNTFEIGEVSSTSPTPTSAQYSNSIPQAPPTPPSHNEQVPNSASSYSETPPQSAQHTYQPFNSSGLPSSMFPPSQSRESYHTDHQPSYPDAHGWYRSQSSSCLVPDTEDRIARPFSSSNTPVEEEDCPQVEYVARENGFSVLVDVLRGFQTNGQVRPLRSHIALQIMQREKDAYRKVGTTTFAQYSTKAEVLGLITLGGRAGTAWMALNEM